jgi:hypothetical protein
VSLEIKAQSDSNACALAMLTLLLVGFVGGDWEMKADLEKFL